MKWKDPSLVVLGLLVMFYAVGLVGHSLTLLLPFMLLLTPWFLAVSGGVILTTYAWGSDLKPLTLWFVPVLLATFGLEVLGVATGWIFGPYHYTSTLGVLFWGVPPVIGLNWVLVVLGVRTAVVALFPRIPTAARVVAVGLICVAYDVLLEPVAIALGYWVWHGPSVPVQNYVAWGLIAVAGAWWAERFPFPHRPVLGWYVLLQAVFFLALGLLGVSV